MKKMRSAQLGLCFVALIAASCGFPRLSELADGGSGAEDGGKPPLDLELLAGDIGGFGSGDGIGATARFNLPNGVAVDSAGNIYVADYFNHTIRKVTATGVVTTLAGTAGIAGSADGTGAAARFAFPSGVAVDSTGNVYVANGTIRKVTPTAVVRTLASTGSCSAGGVAVDSVGNIYVTDSVNNIICKVAPTGVVTTLAGTAGTSGSADGTGAAARFDSPHGVAIDSAGNVYVADYHNATIRKVTAAGVVTTLAGTAGMVGSADGTGAAARFTQPTAVAVDSAGNIYVADQFNMNIRKVTAAGVVTTLAGGTAVFDNPLGVGVDSAGNVYVADTYHSIIRKVTPAGIVTTLAGAVSMFGSADGTGAGARFLGPTGVAVDSAGNVYVADRSNATIRKVTLTGVVTTLAGTPGMAGSADGTGTAAYFANPIGVAVDSTGNLYVADETNHTIRKVTPAGSVTTLAGTAVMPGSADGTGAAARFYFPGGVTVDNASNVYVADVTNHTIRKVTPAGVVTTLAGTAGMSGSADGTGADARFFFPAAVAVDSAGTLYVADQNNSTIRKVTAAGVVTTLAGTAGAVGSADCTGTSARFNRPTGVAVDSAGNVYVADQNNSTIRKVTPTGTTTTVAGTAGVVGILLGATPRFAAPRSLAIVGDSIVVSDANAILLLRHGAQ